MTDQPETAEPQFYIVDLRDKWRRQRYVTLWRGSDAGYCWCLPWAGLYAKSRVDEDSPYYAKQIYQDSAWERFPVPREVVDRLAIHQPRKGDIDGDIGPVLLNDGFTRRLLRAARYVPADVIVRKRMSA